MATTTYVALDKKTVASAVSSVEFTGISGAYTNLILQINGTYSVADAVFGIQFNGDTTSSYSDTDFYGSGTTAGSYESVSQPQIQAGWYPYASSQAEPGSSKIYIPNYSSTVDKKTTIERAGMGGGQGVYMRTGRWNNTAAITSIKLLMSAGNFAVGTTFSLYGLNAVGTSPAPKATGGTIYSDSTYYYHVFGSSDVFTPTSSISADVLCVAGGGGGGSANRGGGGGAGGIIYFAGQSLTATAYSVTVGAGGAGFTQGGNSQFASLTVASGGGRGGASNFAGNYLPSAGGSGGGIGNDGTAGAASNQSSSGATAIYGNAGGSVTIAGNVAGGGGAGAVGTSNDNSNNGVTGGVGTTAFSSWGLATGVGQFVNGSYYLAGGGAGGANISGGGTPVSVRAWGGGGTSGGGGNQYGLANTGGGGGAFSYDNGANTYPAGAGGSGVVIVRYAK